MSETEKGKTERLERIRFNNETLIVAYKCEISDMIEALKDDYQYEEKEEYISFESHDPYDIEQIEIGYTFNNWGVIRFFGIVKTFDRNNDEIITTDSIGCLYEDYDMDKESKRQYKKALKYAESPQCNTDIREWENAPEKNINCFGVDLTYRHIVDSFVCYNNVTHYHTIKGYGFMVESQSLEIVIGAIQLRDLFMHLQPYLNNECNV